ncbi:mCG145581, partial [Mus musculus]
SRCLAACSKCSCYSPVTDGLKCAAELLTEPFLPGSITTPEKTEGTDLDLASRTSCQDGCGAVLLTHVCVGGGSHPEACQQSLGSFVQQKPEVTPASCLAIFVLLLGRGLPCRMWKPIGAHGSLQG